ncbi:MCE family protein [Aquihabitans sp. G128]|uniref:MCE family protein n=1 Tax=Aquihabitans sp. G128 TaxID=2849779 RepID=UPI001C22AEF9|nr:MlaD family protein [Aquihabitans sp. G128]QXC61956.1 MCE family protein [Aquihabitans sp. G128]
MRTRALLLATAVLLGGVGLSGCSADDDQVRATATFDDVADLADGAPVMMSDISIGHVTHIDLDKTGRRAKVRFSVDESAHVPADVVAKVRRTTPLGEKFIDLEPQTQASHPALLRSGTVIKRTAVVSDLEQLVSSGTAAFGALSASQLAILLDEGSRAFGGKGPQLRQVLDDLTSVAAGYETRTGKVTQVIDDLDQLSGDLAPNVDPNAEALSNLNETLGTLNENDRRFFDLVTSLNRLADDGNRLLTKHLDQIRTQVKGLRDVTDAVADEQQALGDVLQYTPEHNEALPQGVRNKFVQALLDVVVCGVPGGGDVPGDPVDACYPGAKGGGR